MFFFAFFCWRNIIFLTNPIAWPLDDPLEVDESQLQSDYEIFYEDVRPELEVTCGGISALRCCRNAADHLRGNVYVQLTGDSTMAIAAATRLNGRWYAGRQITTRLAYLGGGWKAAVCGKWVDISLLVVVQLLIVC